MDANGDNPVLLTRIGGTGRRESYPTWSPDGSKIAFVSDRDRDGGDDIYVMNADGTNPVRLTQHDGYDSEPAWSPDGTKIAFTFRSGKYRDKAEIYVIPSGFAALTPTEHGDTRERATAVGLDSTTPGVLEQPGDMDYFRVDVPRAGRLIVETIGATDTFGVFQSAQGRSIAENDDAGTGNNFRIVRDVASGTYYVAVRGASRSETGAYTLRVGFTAGETSTDHGNTRIQATLVGSNSNTPSGLERAGDVDYFQIDVTETGRMTVETTGTTDTVGYLQGAQGQYLTGNDNAGAETNFRIVRDVTPGTYYVAVVGGDGRTATGSYTFSVRFTAGSGGSSTDHGNSRSLATRVGLNTQTRGALERTGDVDYFRVEVVRAGRLTVDTSGGTDTFGYLGGASGDWLAQNDDSGTEANFRIARDVTPGTYYVAVIGGNGRTATGTYTLAVSVTVPEGGDGGSAADHGNSRALATRVGLNTQTRGALERTGDVDYFRVEVARAGRLTVETTGDTDTVGYFGGADGRWLGQNDDQGSDVNFRIVRQVNAGTYYVAVAGGDARTRTGAYTFHVTFAADGPNADHGNTRERAARVGPNTRTEAALERAGDVDYFRVEAERAGRLTVETTGMTDTFGYLGGANGGWLAQNDDGGTETNFRIVRNVTPGTYYVAVVGYNRTATGPYTLAVRFTAE